MATRRRPKNRRRRALTECESAVLTDGDHIDRFFMTDDEIADLWADHGAEITAQWAAENPGTRPSLWWRYDAPRWSPPARHADYYAADTLPEPRQRLGGTGTPAHEVLAYSPRWPYGVPLDWVHPSDPKHYGPEFKGVPIDPNDPPTYESQASYLQRHGLLLPGEALPDDAFEPETVTYAD